ncbi:uncharacterized protein LY89DRAFT_390394 [Mollisia scopiformis]|uniref:Uncharacterized protein n=1 Tax=Mollisia scopiformis TaxID=149040 RepID=A0A194XQF8_MOLSC|nr:uncharacterized protein LY89DRAFT_390394 [Mollisia scopiformis]KUJ21972.1 hypothetical protein LY89DRAFT_390394 [Mollisia scopiformis]
MSRSVSSRRMSRKAAIGSEGQQLAEWQSGVRGGVSWKSSRRRPLWDCGILRSDYLTLWQQGARDRLCPGPLVTTTTQASSPGVRLRPGPSMSLDVPPCPSWSLPILIERWKFMLSPKVEPWLSPLVPWSMVSAASWLRTRSVSAYGESLTGLL